MTTLSLELEIGDKTFLFVFGKNTSRFFLDKRQYDAVFIKTTLNHFQDKLKAHGVVFLNEVLDALGLQRTAAGQIFGWSSDVSDKISYTVRELDDGTFRLSFGPQGNMLDKLN